MGKIETFWAPLKERDEGMMILKLPFFFPSAEGSNHGEYGLANACPKIG